MFAGQRGVRPVGIKLFRLQSCLHPPVGDDGSAAQPDVGVMQVGISFMVGWGLETDLVTAIPAVPTPRIYELIHAKFRVMGGRLGTHSSSG